MPFIITIITKPLNQVSQKYPVLTGNWKEKIRPHYCSSEQLALLIFNLGLHTLHLKIVHQTPKIHARKVKIYSVLEARGFNRA